MTAEPHLDPLPAEVFDKLRRVHTRVKAGEALWGVYPPSEQTLAEYRAAAAAGTWKRPRREGVTTWKTDGTRSSWWAAGSVG